MLVNISRIINLKGPQALTELEFCKLGIETLFEIMDNNVSSFIEDTKKLAIISRDRDGQACLTEQP